MNFSRVRKRALGARARSTTRRVDDECARGNGRDARAWNLKSSARARDARPPRDARESEMSEETARARSIAATTSGHARTSARGVKRRRAVSFGTTDRVIGVADADVEREPWELPRTCDACGLYCLPGLERWSCERCEGEGREFDCCGRCRREGRCAEHACGADAFALAEIGDDDEGGVGVNAEVTRVERRRGRRGLGGGAKGGRRRRR